MSLTTEVRVGSQYVGVVEITRDSGNSTDPDSVNVYRWAYTNDDIHWTEPAQIEHRYGDGALVLVHKVLGEIIDRLRLAAEMSGS